MADRSSKPKKRHIPNKELFLIQNKILILIFKDYKELLNKNKIFNKIKKIGKKEKQTGLGYKQNILDSIVALEKMRLVKIEEEGEQKENVVLTPIGKELSELIIALEEYNTSYFNLIKSFHEKVSFIPKRDLGYLKLCLKKIDVSGQPEEFREEVEDMKFKLIEKGWSREEIKLYNEILTNLIDFKVICDTNLINILLPRYSEIIKIHNKDLLFLKFLNYLIKVSIEKKVDFILENYESEIYGYSNIRTIYPKYKDVLEIHEDTGGVHQYFLSLHSIFYEKMITFVLEKEIEDMLFAYLELLRPPLTNESHLIDNLKEMITEYENFLKTKQNLHILQKNKIELTGKTAKFFLKILLDYAKRKNIQIITFTY